MTDHDLSTLLRDGADLGADPAANPAADLGRLVAGGIVRGRRLRRRRRVGATVAALAVVACGGLGVVATTGGGEPRAVDPGPAASDAASGATPAPAVPAGPRSMVVSPTRMAEVLASVLPRPSTDPRVWHGDGFRGGSVLLDGALVTVLVERRDADGPGSIQPCDEAPPIAACGRFDDGDWGWGYDAYPEPGEAAADGAVSSSSATLYTADGFTVTATAWNAPSEKGSEPVRSTPVLDSAALTQVASAAHWLG